MALSEGDAHPAVDYLRQAAGQWQALGQPYDQARTLADLGRVLMLADDADEARPALDQALNLIEALAAQLEGAEVQAAFLSSPLVQELQRARAALPGLS